MITMEEKKASLTETTIYGEHERPPAKIYAESALLEHLLGDTMEAVAAMRETQLSQDVHIKTITELKVLLQSLTSSISMMAQASQSMADTFRKTEQRQERLEDRHHESSRGAISLKSHNWQMLSGQVPMFVLSLTVVIWVLYVTKADFKASLKEVAITQRQALDEKVREIRQDVIDGVRPKGE